MASVSVYSANDNVTVAIPIFAKKGRGLGFSIAMIYNSSMYWNPTGASFTPDSDIDQYGPWNVQPTFGEGQLDYDQHSVSAPYRSGYCLYTYDNNFRYYSPDGTMHPLTGAYLASDGVYTPYGGTCHAGTLVTGATAGDGSGWSLSAAASGGASVAVVLTKEVMTARGGTSINLMAQAGQPLVEDTNGNYLSFTTPSSAETDWYDTTSTNPVAKIINQTNCTNPVNGQQYPSCVEYEVPNANGGYATWTMYLANISVNSGSCSGVSAYSGTMTVPMYLVMPEYTSGSHWYYAFAYGGAGRLTTIDYPTGGVTTFTYSDPCTFPDGSVATVTVSTNDGQGHTGTTTYTRNNGGQTTISRPDGSKTIVNYDSSGLPTDVKNYDTDGSTLLSEETYTNTGGTPDFPSTETEYLNGTKVTGVQTSFDSSGDLTSKTVTDELSGASRTTTISYFAPGKPSSITVSSGGTTYSQTNITYDSYGSPSALVNPTTTLDNHDSTYSTTFTNRENPTEIARSTGSTTLDTYLQYDTGGNVVGTVEPNGHTVSATFNQCGGTYASTVAVAGGDDTFSNDCGTGLPLSSAGPNGHATGYTYDADGRLASISDPDGGGKTVTYSSPTEVETQTAISSSLQKTTYALADGYGRTIFAQVADGTACDTVATEYNSMGRVTGVSQPYSEACGAESAPSEVTTTVYDGLGRPVSVTAPNSAITSYAYNVQATTVTGPAPNDVTHILQTNGFGELAAVCEVTNLAGSSNCGLDASGTGYLTTYAYNPLGKLTGVNEDGQTRSFAFDELGRMTSETTPESGTTTFIYDTAGSGCGNYSAPGSLVEREDNMSPVDVTCYGYDPFGRVTSVTYPSGAYASVTPAKTFVYDAATVDGQSMTNAAGRLAEAYTGSSGSKITDDGFGYDAMGRITTNPQCAPTSSGCVWYPMTYTYDLAGDVTSESSANTITYGRDADGRISSVTSSYVDGFHWADILTDPTYNAAGELTSAQLANSTIAESRCYDALGRITDIAVTAGSAPPACGATGLTYGEALTYNLDGTVASVSDTVNGDWTYQHDDLGRLSASACTLHCPDGTNSQAFTYTYDAFGNRTAQTVTAGAGPEPQYSFQNNKITNLTYDGDGNLVADGVHGYTYDAEGHLLSVDGSSLYAYDAFGRRVEHIAAWAAGMPEADVTYDLAGHIAAEHDINNGGFFHQEIYAGALQIASYSDYMYFDFPSALGTGRYWESINGPAPGTCQSLAFGDGMACQQNGGDDSPMRFTGAEHDFESNLDHFRFRQYSSTEGRWTTPDPAGLAAVNPANPQSWNAYAYVGDTPLQATDPLGLMTKPDPSALYTESQDYVLEATQGFEGGENEFTLGSIPVVYAGAQMSFVGNNGMPYSLFADGTNGWQYENDSNGELFNASLGGLELGLPAQPTMFFDSFLTSPLVISNALAQAVGQHIAALPPPVLSPRPRPPAFRPAPPSRPPFPCKRSPSVQVLSGVEFGAVRGTVTGAVGAGGAGEILEPAGGGLVGAAVGGFVGGVFGAMGGVITGVGLALGCHAAGVY